MEVARSALATVTIIFVLFFHTPYPTVLYTKTCNSPSATTCYIVEFDGRYYLLHSPYPVIIFYHFRICDRVKIFSALPDIF